MTTHIQAAIEALTKILNNTDDEYAARVSNDALAALQAAQPVQEDHLLKIISYAYQVCGAHDVDKRILDVLSDPEGATTDQVEAMLPYFLLAQPVQSIDTALPATWKERLGVNWARAHAALREDTMQREIADLRAHIAQRAPSGDEFNSEVLGRVTTYLSQFPEFQPVGDNTADQTFRNIVDCIELLRAAPAPIADEDEEESDTETRSYQIAAKLRKRGLAPIADEVAGDPLDWPIPCDLVDDAVTLRKGVKLRTVLARMKMLSALCGSNLPKAYRYDVEHPNDGLNGAPKASVPDEPDTVRDLDRIGMQFAADLCALPVVGTSDARNVDYLTRQDVMNLVVAWRAAWNKNSASRPPIDRAPDAPAGDLLANLIEAASILRSYEVYHRAKNTEDSLKKAEVNAELAGRFEATIARAAAAPAGHAEPVAWGLLEPYDQELTTDPVLADYWKRKGRKITPLFAAPVAAEPAPDDAIASAVQTIIDDALAGSSEAYQAGNYAELHELIQRQIDAATLTKNKQENAQ